jgi:hypothetical protein
MKKGEENDRAKKDVYHPISRSSKARRATGTDSEDSVRVSDNWLRGKE